MPRKARNICNAKFFHVIVQGINKEYIFKTERYMEKYLEIIHEFAKELNVEIIAYCMMNNHAHFVIYVQNMENLSKLMRKTNTKFAKYYNFTEERVGYVFRDRFRSEPIMDAEYLVTCINYIHNNPVKANIVKYCERYEYSTYNQFLSGEKIKKLNELLKVKFDVKMFTKPQLKMINFDVDISEIEILDYSIYDFICRKKITLDKIFEDRKILIDLIQFMKKEYKITYISMMKKLDISRHFMKLVQ